MTTNREDFRRALLQSSLNDALLGTADLFGVHLTAGSTSSFLPNASTCLAGLSSGTMDSRFAPLFGASRFAASTPRSSTSSLMGLNLSDDRLLLAVAAATERNELLAKAQANIVRHQIEQERKRILLKKSYLDVLCSEAQARTLGGFSLAGMQPLMTSPHPIPNISKEVTQAKALEALGCNLRTKTDPYIDVSDVVDPCPKESELRRTRGGVSEPFPERLHRMLKEVEEQGMSEVVSFYSHGRAFGVHDMDRFVYEIMPKYFKQTKFNSFARQLNLYGFIRISSGPDAGGYYHELFLKGKPNLVLHMRRVGVPQGDDRRKLRPKNSNVEPDFYSMKKISS